MNHHESNPYAEPKNPALPASTMELERGRSALVVIDPQNDFLDERGLGWGVVGQSVTENNTVENLEELFKAAKAVDLPVLISPHFYFPTDYGWAFEGPLVKVMHSLRMFDRAGSLNLEGFEGSGADFLERYKKYIYDGKTVIASPHKIYGPEHNDLILQLRQRHVEKIVLAGMAANLCVDSHMRELVEQGFEVAVVKDATAAPKLPEGDGYLAALTNYRMVANALWTTREAVKRISRLGA